MPLIPQKRKPLRPGSAGYLQQYGAGTGLYKPRPLPKSGYGPGSQRFEMAGGSPIRMDYLTADSLNANALADPDAPQIGPYTGGLPAYGDVPMPDGTGGDGTGGTTTPDPRIGTSRGIWHKPDYSGILSRYKGDWEARLNAGLQSMEAQRLGRARSSINRLGIRDPSAMLEKLGKYGLTAEDLQQAADNPWSELKAITQQAERARGQGMAEYAGRGTFRSGGTARALEDVENARARNEAMATEEALSGLSGDQFEMAEWERQQRDELDQAAMGLEGQLAQAYQPYEQQAYWDPNAGGYVLGNTVYDQNGNPIRTI